MKRILLLEQERIVNLDISISLRSAGLSVFTLRDLQAADGALIPDLIIMDSLSYFTLAADDRQKLYAQMLKGIPVILIGSHALEKIVAAKCNVVAQLIKPFNTSSLTDLCLQCCSPEMRKIA